MLERAIAIAKEELNGVLDYKQEPMINHALRMMEKMDTEDEKIVAVLHDVIEESLCSFKDLREAGFNRTVLEGVDMLTKRNDMTYFDYIDDISTNPLAVKVKLAEMEENKDQDRVNKLSFQTYKLDKRVEKVYQILKNQQY